MFGLGKGKIDIRISQFNFNPGDTIEGEVILKLNKPIKARSLNIRLVGTRKSKSYSTRTKSQSSNYSTIFDFKQPLDGEKEYSSSELNYKFQIKIPENILTQPKFGDGIAGTLIKSAQILSGTNVRIDWYLIANLDIKKAFDVSKKLQINIA